MCARYGALEEFNLFERTYRISLPEAMVLPKGIVYPHTPAPVIVAAANQREVHLMSYSLVPSWSKTRKPKFATYNARIEEVLNKPSWREPFKSRHCLVPIQFFIESVHTGRFAGHNIGISAKDHHPLTAAGIWDTWTDRESGEVLESFAIITGEPPADVLEAGHDRCPIFLPENSWGPWLDGNLKDKELVEFLKNSREVVEFSFEEREALKSYNPQLSLLDDE
ncbi:SOS response-associated peptidase [Bdellovibrio bacteriovorus]|uniref:SOS response-associated peptidase n=1 Tax=Bdellovibrio bacteriovorus TaxID=959 RepID=UPI003AA823C0